METQNNIKAVKHEMCTGCGVCSTVCSFDAIKMMQEEDGFYYPHIDEALCVECAKCLRKCHVKNYHSESKDITKDKYYAGKFKDMKILDSSSGGAATAISEVFINEGGIVWGCAYSSDFRSVKYEYARTIIELDKFKTSKYIQAEPPNYITLLEQLEAGIKVLFIGLPCQVDSIYKYLGKEYDNLTTISLICHGPTSQIVLKKFVNELESSVKGKKIIDFKMRYKWRGRVRPTTIYYKTEDGKEKGIPFIDSGLGIAFEILNRESCYNCLSKYPNGHSDIIIGDFWGGSNGKKQNNNGESLIIVRNQLKEDILDKLKGLDFDLIEASNVNISSKNPALFFSKKMSSSRRKFVKNLESMSLEDSVKKCVPLKRRIKKRIYYYLRLLIPDSLWENLKSISKNG